MVVRHLSGRGAGTRDWCVRRRLFGAGASAVFQQVNNGTHLFDHSSTRRGRRYVIGQHAAERLDERGVLEWQVVDGLANGALIDERPDSGPNPSVEVSQLLADGKEINAIWSHVISVDVAKLVTVHFFDE
ncbi:MAG: DUF4258 domain-containing protein [Tepidisphaeraceae bacterium]